MSTSWIRVVYGVVLGLVVLFSAGFGVAMALPGPKPPADPGITFRQLSGGTDTDTGSNKLAASVDAYYGDAHAFRQRYVTYQRNAFLALAVVAAVVALVGLALPASVNYLRWGLLLGGVFVLAWAGYLATRAVPNPANAASSVLELVAAGEPRPLDFAGRFLRFAVSFVSLILLLFVGLWRLTEWPAPAPRTAPVGPRGVAPAVAVQKPSAPVPASAPNGPLTNERPSLVADPVVEPARPAGGIEPLRSEPIPPEAQQWQRPPDAEERGAPPHPETSA